MITQRLLTGLGIIFAGAALAQSLLENRDSSRNINSGCDDDDSDGFPQGILASSTKDERVAACTDLLQTN